MDYTTDNYKEDLLYYLNYLKTNSSNCYNINVNEIYNKYIDELNNINNLDEFSNLLKKIHKENLPFNIYGHNQPKALFFNIDDWSEKFMNDENNKCYIDVLNQMNKISDKGRKRYMENKINEGNNVSPYKLSIIKNDKNEDVMFIKFEYPMRYPSPQHKKELEEFLINNKHLKELYIDIRDNGGGSIYSYKVLFNIIFNRKLFFKHKQVKYYFKYTKKNKPFINHKLDITKMKQAKKKNNKYTHYIIKKFDGITYPIEKVNCNIDYQGNIFIIINNKCFSAAQCMLDECQGNKNIIILGDEKSGGFGHYEIYKSDNDKYASSLFILPNTKILCNIDLFATSKNKYKTKPDLPIPKWLK